MEGCFIFSKEDNSCTHNSFSLKADIIFNLVESENTEKKSAAAQQNIQTGPQPERKQVVTAQSERYADGQTAEKLRGKE